MTRTENGIKNRRQQVHAHTWMNVIFHRYFMDQMKKTIKLNRFQLYAFAPPTQTQHISQSIVFDVLFFLLLRCPDRERENELQFPVFFSIYLLVFVLFSCLSTNFFRSLPQSGNSTLFLRMYSQSKCAHNDKMWPYYIRFVADEYGKSVWKYPWFFCSSISNRRKNAVVCAEYIQTKSLFSWIRHSPNKWKCSHSKWKRENAIHFWLRF